MVQHLPKETLKSKDLHEVLDAFKNEDDIEVKIELIHVLKFIGVTIGIDFLNLVSQMDLAKIMMENNWRVRRAGLNMIVELAESFKSVELFEVHLQDLFLQYLDDRIFAIRRHGNSLLPVSYFLF